MPKRIGEFLADKGLITPSQIPMILSFAERNKMRFGDAALALNLFTHDDLVNVLGPSYKIDYFHIEAGFFPAVTKDLLPVDLMIRGGVLPLGFKTEQKLFRTRKVVNIGMLDPDRADIAFEVEKIAQSKLGEIEGIKIFLVIADQFLEVLQQVYGITESDLRKTNDNQMDPRLKLFLEHH